MAITVAEIFSIVGIDEFHTILWSNIKVDPIPNSQGVYIIELPLPLSPPVFDEMILNQWFENSRRVSVGNQRANAPLVNDELHKHWKPQETILYIGQAGTSVKGLQKRLTNFYGHNPGNKGPHAGGYWIKLLREIGNLNVHYAVCANAHEKEFKMLMYFAMKNSGHNSIFDIEDIGSYLPFANLKGDIYKNHNITGAMKTGRDDATEI